MKARIAFGILWLWAVSSITLTAAPLTIILDPGHGGNDPGTITRGVKESALNLKLARQVEKRLKSYGYRVVLTRRGDYYVSLEQRGKMAGKYRRSLLVSIHCNHGISSAQGVETFSYRGQGSKGYTLACTIQRRLMALKLFKNRGVKKARFAVLCNHRHPAILVECGFLSHWRDRKYLSSPRQRTRIADAITQGIRDAVLKR